MTPRGLERWGSCVFFLSFSRFRLYNGDQEETHFFVNTPSSLPPFSSVSPCTQLTNSSLPFLENTYFESVPWLSGVVFTFSGGPKTVEGLGTPLTSLPNFRDLLLCGHIYLSFLRWGFIPCSN